MIKEKKQHKGKRRQKSIKQLKSRSKDCKIIEKRVSLTQPNIQDAFSDRSAKKSSKSRSKNMRSIGGKAEGLKLVKSQKKIGINCSEQIKNRLHYTPMESLKDNLGILKFKKLKSPFKANKSPQGKVSQQKAELLGQRDKTIKTKVKNKSISVSSKRGTSKGKALSSNKTLTKRSKGESKNELKIYTSTSFNPKKR